jgi:hypothetical protein
MKANAALKDMCKQKDLLMQQVLQFNFNLISYVHPDRLPSSIPANWILSLQTTPRSKRKLNSFLQYQFNLGGQFCFDFSNPVSRLALLDLVALKQLMLVAGTACYAEVIAKFIEKSKINQFKESVGESYYTFAVKRAAILFRNKPEIQLPPLQETNFVSNIFNAGKELIERALEGEPLAILKRLELKFEPELKWHFQHDTAQESKEKIWAFLKKLILNEINPTLRSCFN